MVKYEKLEQLQALKNNGSITEVEFEIEKQKILNSNDNTNKTKGIYIASLVLGICALLFGIVPFLGLILSVVALVISIVARKKLKAEDSKSGIVTAGIITSILGLIFAIIITGTTILGGMLSLDLELDNSTINNELITEEAKEFNKTFEKYKGTLSYNDTQSLLTTIKFMSWGTNGTIKINGKDIVTDEYAKYNVKFKYGNDGRINEITITKSK